MPIRRHAVHRLRAGGVVPGLVDGEGNNEKDNEREDGTNDNAVTRRPRRDLMELRPSPKPGIRQQHRAHRAALSVGPNVLTRRSVWHGRPETGAPLAPHPKQPRRAVCSVCDAPLGQGRETGVAAVRDGAEGGTSSLVPPVAPHRRRSLPPLPGGPVRPHAGGVTRSAFAAVARTLDRVWAARRRRRCA